MPDLTDEPVDVIVEAVFAAIAEAHHPARGEGTWDNAPCDSCWALIELASHYGDPTHMVWPDPVKRQIAQVLDEVIAEMKT